MCPRVDWSTYILVNQPLKLLNLRFLCSDNGMQLTWGMINISQPVLKRLFDEAWTVFKEAANYFQRE